MNDTRAARLQNLSLHFFAAQAQQISALKSRGADIIHLDIGSPDLPPPEVAVETLIQAARSPQKHGYQPHTFSFAYRRAWSDFYQRNFSVTLDAEREIVPLIGSKEGIFHLMLAVINPGDVVLVPDPGYITYIRGVQLAGGIPVVFPLDRENNYFPVFKDIPSKIRQSARALWLNYPNNPTSAAATQEIFHQAVEFADQNELILCHDAAYTQICADDYRAPSILQVAGAKEVAVEFNTLSKSHAMAGWRVGALLGNPAVLSALFALKTNADSGHFLPIIEAATSALAVDQEWFSARNRIYDERRETLLRGFKQIGWKAYPSRAGLYVWVEIPEYAHNSQQFSALVLEKTHISVTPGTVFGSQDRFLRFSLTSDRIQEAADRLKEWVNNAY